MFYIQDSPGGLSEEGLKGLQSILKKKLWNIGEEMKQTRERYLRVLSGKENINFLDDNAEDDGDDEGDDEYYSDSEMSGDEL